jgi:hypothetical protein
MPDSTEHKIDAIAHLAAEVAKNSRTREEAMSKLLEQHSCTLSVIHKAVTRVDLRTEGIVRDIVRQEAAGEKHQMQIDNNSADINKMKGIGAVAAFLLSCGEAAIGILLRR